MNPSDQVTTRQLKYFVAVAEHSSFRGAADRLGVTQPTLTAQVANLEKMLGVKLLERSRAGTSVTPIGREMLPGARRVLEEMQGFCDRASSMSGGIVGTYRLGVTPTLGPYLLPHILPAIHSRYAGLKLYVREAAPADLEAELRQAQHDLILTTMPVAHGDLVVAPLFREPLMLAIAEDHPLAANDEIKRDDLQGQQILTIGEHHLFHHQVTRLCEELGATLRRDYEGTSLDTLRHMVVMGMGLAFLPSLYVASEIRGRDELKVKSLSGEGLYRIHALVWRPTAPARGLFRELAEQIRVIAGSTIGEMVTILSDQTADGAP